MSYSSWQRWEVGRPICCSSINVDMGFLKRLTAIFVWFPAQPALVGLGSKDTELVRSSEPTPRPNAPPLQSLGPRIVLVWSIVRMLSITARVSRERYWGWDGLVWVWCDERRKEWISGVPMNKASAGDIRREYESAVSEWNEPRHELNAHERGDTNLEIELFK